MKFADTLMAMFKGQGKGKGKGDCATCWTCGLTGHIARNCTKGVGKRGKAKVFNGAHHNCGKWGHRAAECWGKGKGKGKGLNEMNWGWTWTGGAELPGGTGAEANLGGGKGAEAKGYYDNNGNWVLGEIAYDKCYHSGYAEKKQDDGKLGEINGVKQSKWEKLPMVADSGAVDHVCSKGELGLIPIESKAASRAGMCYRGANGNKIANFGMRRINGITQNGTRAKMEIQVADVRRGLVPIPKTGDENNYVVFSKRGSYIWNVPTGAVSPMRRANGVMELE